MSPPSAALFELSREALGTTQVELGEMLGVPRRTAQRWATQGVPSYGMQKLAELVHPADPKLAAQTAASSGTTLEAWGIVGPAPVAPPPPAPASHPDVVVDTVVCAAADVIERMPRDVRPALLAAFARAREIGLTVEEVERALGAKLHPASSPATPKIDKRRSATAPRGTSSKG